MLAEVAAVRSIHPADLVRLRKLASPGAVSAAVRLALARRKAVEKFERGQQMWVELTGVNLEISSRPWRFESGHLDRLRRQGLAFTDVTINTIPVCQDRFISDSPRVRSFMERFRAERAVHPRVVECDTADAVA